MDLQTITSEIRAIKKMVSKDTTVELSYKDVDDDTIFAIAKSNENARFFKADPSIPYSWCHVFDGNVQVTVRGKEKSYKLIK